MSEQVTCPSVEALQQFVQELLPAADRVALEAHVSSCPTCQERLKEVDRESVPDKNANTPSELTAAFLEGNEDENLREVGPYAIEDMIGKGGMGVVLRATDPVFQRSLAIKIISTKLATAAKLRSRFLDEARLMGQLQHPGIPPVHALGELDDGRPYFAMKLIKGQTLEALLSARKPDHGHQELPEFLARFEHICQTVAYAHSRQVIHRDLKPANVMVGAFGEVQVMDWGLAKVVGKDSAADSDGQETSETTVMPTPAPNSAWETQMGEAKGTTAYMSPEQARGEMDIDVRTDVFALGAILCKMLTGKPAFTGGNPQNLLAARHGRLDEAFARLETCTADRELVELTKRCLAPSRHDRPADAGVVAQAVAGFRAAQQERLKQAEIARATAELRTEQERKRRRVVLTLSAAVILVLAGGVASFAWASARLSQTNHMLTDANLDLARSKTSLEESNTNLDAANQGLKDTNVKLVQARNVADEKRKQAEKEQKIALSVRRFLQHDLLRQADPTDQANRLLALGGSGFIAVENPTIKELLDRTALELTPEKIEQKFPGEPLVQAEILLTVGDTYIGVGNFAQAIDHLERSRALYQAQLGSEHPDTLASMNNLATGYRAAGKLDLALPLLEETFKLRKAKLGPEHTATLTSMSNLAIGYHGAGRLDLGILLLEETFRLTKGKLGPDHPATFTTKNNLALGYLDAGKLYLALPLFEETLKLRKAKLGPDHPATIISMNCLAEGYQRAGKLDLAVPLFEETLKLQNSKLGPDHPDTLITMSNLASGYQATGKLNLALPLIEETLKLTKAKLGPDHPNTLRAMNNLAAGYWGAKRLDKSIPLFEEVLKLREDKFGRTHPDTLNTAGNLGVNYKDAGRLTEALPLLEEAYRASGKVPYLRGFGVPLFDTYVKAGHGTDAASLAKELLADMRKALPKDSPQLAAELAQVGMALLQAKAFAEAEPILRECHAIRAKGDPHAWTTFNTQSMLGGALLGQKKYADAEPLLLSGYEGMKARAAKIPPQGKVRLTEAEGRLAELFEATREKTESKIPGALASAKREAIHEVKLSAGKAVVILMQSKDFDPLLRLTDAGGKTLAENDDIDPAAKNLNSRIWFMPEADGIYRIVATSYQEKGRGDYEIIVREFWKKK